MTDRKFDQEPAEGSREIVERDLARQEPEGQPKGEKDLLPAGPHAKEDLTNRDATPGSGALPQVTPDDDADAGTG